VRERSPIYDDYTTVDTTAETEKEKLKKEQKVTIPRR
jgi:hypothetical protein